MLLCRIVAAWTGELTLLGRCKRKATLIYRLRNSLVGCGDRRRSPSGGGFLCLRRLQRAGDRLAESGSSGVPFRPLVRSSGLDRHRLGRPHDGPAAPAWPGRWTPNLAPPMPAACGAAKWTHLHHRLAADPQKPAPLRAARSSLNIRRWRGCCRPCGRYHDFAGGHERRVSPAGCQHAAWLRWAGGAGPATVDLPSILSTLEEHSRRGQRHQKLTSTPAPIRRGSSYLTSLVNAPGRIS